MFPVPTDFPVPAPADRDGGAETVGIEIKTLYHPTLASFLMIVRLSIQAPVACFVRTQSKLKDQSPG